jgi:predicted DNA binding CopG/RHH family protein
MNYYDLSDKEQKELEEIETALEKGDLKSVPNLETERKRLQEIARNTLNKTRNINIRLTERDLHNLKAKAIEEGIPYQTLAASILHKATK